MIRRLGPVPIRRFSIFCEMNDSKAKTAVLIGLGFLLPMVAARAARTVAGGGYTLVTRKDPPKNPASRDTELRDAIIWTAVSGALGGIARMFARRYLSDETEIPAEGDGMDEATSKLA